MERTLFFFEGKQLWEEHNLNQLVRTNFSKPTGAQNRADVYQPNAVLGTGPYSSVCQDSQQ